MSYLSIYRRFRPQAFDKVIGQEHITKTLINQIKADKIGHAYLFCGTRGTGKTSTAKIFAKAINCLSPENGSPCGKCKNCLALSEANSPDIFEIDAASNNKVENIREIRDKVQYPPVVGKYKVYIIDEVHMLTGEAFNALLKTLEEPPKHAVFILATTEVYKIPSTILSRCMRFDFRLIPIEELSELIKEIFTTLGKKFEDDAVKLIARSGEGCVRDALSVAETCASFSDGVITLASVQEVLGATDDHKIIELIEQILACNSGEALKGLNELICLGKSVGMIFKDIISCVRELLTVASTTTNFLGLTSEKYQKYKDITARVSANELIRIMEIFSLSEGEIRYGSHPRIILETAVIKASLPKEDTSAQALSVRVAKLEKLVEELSLGKVYSQPKPIVEQVAMPVVEKTKPIVVEEKSTEYIQEVKPTEQKPNFEQVQQVQINLEVKSEPQGQVFAGEDSKKVWGAVIRKIRRKSLTLFAVCSERITEVKGDTLCIYADGEGDYALLTKADNLSKIQEAVQEVAPLKVAILEKSGQLLEKEQVDKDLEKVVEIFGKDKVIKEN